jgi:hypothetical protein
MLKASCGLPEQGHEEVPSRKEVWRDCRRKYYLREDSQDHQEPGRGSSEGGVGETCFGSLVLVRGGSINLISPV